MAEIVRLGTLTMESYYQCNVANSQQTVLPSFNPDQYYYHFRHFVFCTVANGDFPK